MAENAGGDLDFRVPAVDWDRTARDVLTLEWIDGTPLSDRAALAARGFDLAKLGRAVIQTFLRHAMRDGFFHADMHPGNLFVGKDGQLIAVDFGITGRVDKETRRFLGEMLIGFLNGNYRRVAEVHFEAGFVPPDKSVDAFSQACRSFAEPILGRPLHEISIARLLGQLFQVTETFDMEVQPQLLLLQKSMLVAEGVGRHLDPHINMWQLARPLIEQWMANNLGPQARVRETMGAVVASLESLPRLVAHAEKTVEALRRGGFGPPSASTKPTKAGARGLFPAWLPWALVVVLAGALVLRR
jgi:ubiquinone biosynthesis protein